MQERYDPALAIDRDARGYRYYRNAVERHWDPAEVDLSADVDRLVDSGPVGFDELRRTLALFGAGEQAVAEDLAPLAAVLEGVEDQLFVATQLYEEAKHADFFDRYWREVVNEVEGNRGIEVTSPADDRWFGDDYDELFARNERAMTRLLDDDSPESRASAYCHYHLVIEGILAQTGYYGVQTSYSGEDDELPELPGLVEGFTKIRGDEGRHVGFGMAKLKALVEQEAVSPAFLRETVQELVPLTHGIVQGATEADGPGVTPNELVAYAAERHTQRMDQILDATREVPNVSDLVELSGG